MSSRFRRYIIATSTLVILITNPTLKVMSKTIPVPKGINYEEYVLKLTDSYNYINYDVYEEEGKTLLDLEEDIVTKEQSKEIYGMYLDYLKANKLSLNNLSPYTHMYYTSLMFQDNFDYINTGDSDIFTISGLLKNKKGSCRPISVLYHNLLEQLKIKNEIIVTYNSKEGSSHSLIKVYPFENLNLSILVDVSGNVQYGGNSRLYGIAVNREYITQINSVPTVPHILDDVL